MEAFKNIVGVTLQPIFQYRPNCLDSIDELGLIFSVSLTAVIQ